MGANIKAIRARPRLEYEPPRREHPDAAEALVNHVAQKQIQRAERKRSNISEFDLPVDEPPALQEETPKKKTTEKKKDLFLESLKQSEPVAAPVVMPEPEPEPIVEQLEISCYSYGYYGGHGTRG